MKTFEKILLGCVTGLIFVIGIIIGVLFSGNGTSEIEQLTNEKNSLETKFRTQTNTIKDLESSIEKSEKKNEDNEEALKQLQELTTFIPAGSEKSVQELYDEEQNNIQTEKERIENGKKAEQKRKDEEKVKQEQEQEQKQLIINVDTCAQTKVKTLLLSPRSAKFPWVLSKDITSKIDENTYKVQSYVDSENTFGAMIRNNYVCNIEVDDEGTGCYAECSFY